MSIFITVRAINTNELHLVYLLAGVIFIIDCIIPLGVAVGVLYVSCIVLLINQATKKIVFFALLATLLTIAIPIFTTNEFTTWMAYVNRAISVIAIWFSTYIAIRHKKRQEEVLHYLNELKHKNQALEEYNYITSHDLQEPLRTITNMTNLLFNDYAEKFDGNAKKSLLFMKEATTRMSGLIEGILTYSKIGVSSNKKLIDCNKLVKVILQDMAASINESLATFDIKDLPIIYGFEMEIRMLFQNLISNAVKFRREGVIPHIEIDAKRIEDKWQFFVKDNGIGIKKSKTERIFLVFQRLHKRNEYEGSGIGLSYCKKIVQLHKGEIWVEANNDFGSTFYFTINDQQ